MGSVKPPAATRWSSCNGGETYEQSRFEAMAERRAAIRCAHGRGGRAGNPAGHRVLSLALSGILTIAMIQAQGNQTTVVGGFTGFVMAMLLPISPLKHLTDLNQPLQRGLTAGRDDLPASSTADRAADRRPAAGTCRRRSGARGRRPAGDATARRPACQFPAPWARWCAGRSVRQRQDHAGQPRTPLLRSDRTTPDPARWPAHRPVRADRPAPPDCVREPGCRCSTTPWRLPAYGVHPREAIDMARVERALAAAYLTDTVKGLPEGLETNIGDNGMKRPAASASGYTARDLQGRADPDPGRGDFRARFGIGAAGAGGAGALMVGRTTPS